MRSTCTTLKASFVQAEIRAHILLRKQGRSKAYKAAERASEQAFKRGHKHGCSWAR